MITTEITQDTLDAAWARVDALTTQAIWLNATKRRAAPQNFSQAAQEAQQAWNAVTAATKIAEELLAAFRQQKNSA